MMRRILTALLIAVLAISSGSALAAGKLNVAQENFILDDAYGNLYGYAYAKIENTGDKPIKVNAGILEIYDANGDVITSSDWLSAYAEYLQPGEYTYAYLYSEIVDKEIADVTDYMLAITGKSDADAISQRLPVVTAYEQDVNMGYYSADFMYATVTNDTEEIMYDVTVAFALLDAEGNILYIANSNMYETKGIMPGSSVIFREEVTSNVIDAYEKLGFIPASADAIAYKTVYQD